MYNEEWEPVMTAESMEERVAAFADLARDRAEERGKSVESVVYDLTHDGYLLKHTTGDVLRELADLQDAYPDAFYNGAANEHVVGYLEGTDGFEFWFDFAYLALAAGLEWAVLQEVEESSAEV